MQKIALFQVIYTKYKTSTNKDRVKKQFIFLEEIEKATTIELLNACTEAYHRYKAYNNVITLDYDTINKGYIFSKSRLISLKLNTTKGELQDGEKIELSKRW